MTSLKDIAILAPGKLNPHAKARVAGTFTVIETASSDPALKSRLGCAALRR
jgi:hypothetical protein